MMILAGIPLGFSFGVLSPSADDPAARIAEHHEHGSLYDRDAIRRLAAWADVTTFEIEHIDTAALAESEQGGACILPRPSVLRTINDKLEQKLVLERAGIPLPAFGERPSGYPTVQKLRRGGYDGRGVLVLRDERDTRLPGESYFEQLVDVERELAVIVVRSSRGKTATYPVFEMEFDPVANICSRVIAPARIDPAREAVAREIALASVEAIDGVGVLAVELFVSAAGTVLVNEIAPRPHNSGHLTIDACATSQFEQHLRAITGLPLGPVGLRAAAVMVNVLGAHDADGRPELRTMDELLGVPDAHLHWYGKRDVRPNRKMGHVTVVADTVEEALDLADRITPATRVTGSER